MTEAPPPSQLLGDLCANSFGGARDYGDFSAQFFHENPLWMLGARPFGRAATPEIIDAR
jgi:hypothetical protein